VPDEPDVGDHDDDEAGEGDQLAGEELAERDPKVRTPLDTYKDVEPSPMPAIAPDGGFAPGPIGQPPPIPAATPEHFICLRGPCRSYWQMETFIASGNPKSTWDPVHGLKDPTTGEPLRVPRQISRSCLTHPGTTTELTDDNVYECSRWDPLTPRELKKREGRRSKYLGIHPEHDPKRRT
jgi:hypothetical protein